MPTITHTPLGKVAAIWGSALIRDANGKMRVLKVDDEVKNGDVILTTQGGFVRINEAEPTATAAAVKPAAGTDVDRVIAGLNDGDLDIAPGAGLRGGDGENQQVGVRGGADFLHQFGQAGLGLALLLIAVERPLGVIDMIEQMHDVPAFSRHEWGDFLVGHDGWIQRRSVEIFISKSFLKAAFGESTVGAS